MPDWAAVAERVWYGRGVAAAVARATLAPAEALFRVGVAARGALYDAGLLAAHALPAPAIGVGNLTVGGTGKTPVAAWIARRLLAHGGRPGIVLRGYGDDEPAVHALLTPDAVVVANADRVAGAAEAVARGADVLVLDDAFQHRRARRDVDVVLVSAERWGSGARLLPAGPLREPLAALRRATLVLVTRKVAPDDALDAVLADLARRVPEVPRAAVTLALDDLRRWAPAGEAADPADRAPLATLAGSRVLAIAAVGEPSAFFAQLRDAGATVEPAPFSDHHAFTDDDVARLVARAAAADAIVCTLKDAVKLGPRWPRLAPPFWYVSQRVTVERGGDVLESALVALRQVPTDGRPPRPPS